ncbi:MAG: hypothetical protein ACYCT1_18725 [Steroidobacteraceae bacterium]
MSGGIPAAAALERFVRAQDPLLAQVRAELASGGKSGQSLEKYFAGRPDSRTLELLAADAH